MYMGAIPCVPLGLDWSLRLIHGFVLFNTIEAVGRDDITRSPSNTYFDLKWTLEEMQGWRKEE